MWNRATFLSIGVFALASSAIGQAYRPSPSDMGRRIQRANELGRLVQGKVIGAQITPRWIADGEELWYRVALREGRFRYEWINCVSGKRGPLFESAKLADALAKATKEKVDPDKLNIDVTSVSRVAREVKFNFKLKKYAWKNAENSLVEDTAPAATPTQPQAKKPNRTIATEAGNLVVSDTASGSKIILAPAQGRSKFALSPDQKCVIGWSLTPGDRKQAHLVASVLPGFHGELRSRFYDLPGDSLDTFKLELYRADTGKLIPHLQEPVMGGGQPWAEAPEVRWVGDHEFFYDYPIRGYQTNKIIRLDAETGQALVEIVESERTFVDQSNFRWTYLPRTNSILLRSERDGFGHLYLLNASDGSVKRQLTHGRGVIREIERVDEELGIVYFRGNGHFDGDVAADEDPYFLHTYSVTLDGAKLADLTPGAGTHTVQWSPNRRFYVDTRSTVNTAPVHELRRTADGGLVCELEKADFADYLKTGIRMPEPFMAMGRDGKTPIYGIICRPSQFDPKKKYPVIENIYAGPQDSFVPKGFRPVNGMQQLAELGFIVVQIDGMGTNNRGKAFHDVCYKNIKDAGFPDRILWMQAMANKYPYADITRVGVYGTSAGGQNAAGAVIFHPEFYKAAVASCGCHDNRMDKQWWNEQWMGYPVDKSYSESSNIDNAKLMKGNLLLIVGELDSNVPPESTYRLLDALIKAGKKVEFMMIPGANHTDGGPYGEKLRRDFFIRHLHNIEPPPWPGPVTSGGSGPKP